MGVCDRDTQKEIISSHRGDHVPAILHLRNVSAQDHREKNKELEVEAFAQKRKAEKKQKKTNTKENVSEA